MSTTMNRAEEQAQVSSEKTRSFVLPAVTAVILFAVIVYIQFSLVLKQYGFFAELPLGIGFYFCYAWHRSLAQKANVHAEKLKKG